jgi:hypothetical protein
MPNPVKVTRLLTRKKKLDESRIEVIERDLTPAPGEIIMMPDHFALTTNNITYAAFGDSMRYWDFYPTGEADWGHVPVWGFANVVASGVEGVNVGDRYYGYYPVASHVWVQPGVTPRGFRALDEHRAELPTPYNQYPLCSADPYYSPEHEDLQALLKPLYLTSAMLADFLIDNNFFGAKRLVFSSASSKTAYCTLFCIEGHEVERIGLTSRGNIEFVEQLGCYDSALAYQDLETLDASVPTLYVDFSSDLTLRDRVHAHFGDNLVYSCVAGSAQNTEEAEYTASSGPEPKMFFAPIQMRKRNVDWGSGGVSRYVGEGMVKFYKLVEARGDQLVEVVQNEGFEAAGRIIADLVHGRLSPQQGQIVRLR